MSARDSVLRKAEKCIDKADDSDDHGTAGKHLQAADVYLRLAAEMAPK